MLVTNSLIPNTNKKNKGIPAANNNNKPCIHIGTSKSKGVWKLLKIYESGNEEENIIKIDPISIPSKAIAEKKMINNPITFEMILKKLRNKSLSVVPI